MHILLIVNWLLSALKDNNKYNFTSYTALGINLNNSKDIHMFIFYFIRHASFELHIKITNRWKRLKSNL